MFDISTFDAGGFDGVATYTFLTWVQNLLYSSI
jgi:hypothetical protein